MADNNLGHFRCLVLTPQAKVLDCKTPSVVLPAHDGQVGIWRNHMPMLVELGMGIMEIKAAVSEENDKPADKFLLVDEGFARISNNVVTIMAYEITSPGDVKPQKAGSPLAQAQEQVPDRETRKARLLEQLVKLSAGKEHPAA